MTKFNAAEGHTSHDEDHADEARQEAIAAQQDNEAIDSDPFGFFGSFGPSQSERAEDEGWELDDED